MNKKETLPFLCIAVLGFGIFTLGYIEHMKLRYVRYLEREVQNKTKETQEKNTHVVHVSPNAIQRRPALIPVNTRYVNDYQTIGYLQQESGERILPLYGRRLHVSSTLWNYYTRTDQDRSMLLPIVIQGQRCTERYGCKELFDGDTIRIPEYGGEYIVHLY